MTKQIKVIKILDSETLLVNIGSNQNIAHGQSFEVYEVGEEIRDPETKELLGTLDYIKAEIEVTQVYPNFSLMKSIDYYTETVTSGIMSAFSDKTKETTKAKVQRLAVDPGQITPMKINNKKIVIGDPVRKI